jgi:hypothetical protein
VEKPRHFSFCSLDTLLSPSKLATPYSSPFIRDLDIPRAARYYDVRYVITGGSMIRTQIQLTEEQKEEVRRIARARHVSIAEIIREAVDNVIRSGAGMAAGEEDRRRRALNAVGKFNSGKRDISREHDKYLSEAFRK